MDPAFVPVLTALVGMAGGLGGAYIGGKFALRIARDNIASQERKFEMERRDRQVAGLLREAKLIFLDLRALQIKASRGEDTGPLLKQMTNERLADRDFEWVGIADEGLHTAADRFFHLTNVMSIEMVEIIAAGRGQYVEGMQNIPSYWDYWGKKLGDELKELTKAVDRYVMHGSAPSEVTVADTPRLGERMRALLRGRV